MDVDYQGLIENDVLDANTSLIMHKFEQKLKAVQEDTAISFGEKLIELEYAEHCKYCQRMQ